MISASVNIARFTLLEILRTRALIAVIGSVLMVAVIAEFSAALAITDSVSYRSGIYGALVRLVMVGLTVLFVVASVVREFHDRMLDLSLSRPVSRMSWYIGRASGFAVMASLFALIAALPLLRFAAHGGALGWTVSLALELTLMAIAALTCVITLRQMPLAVAATGAFYVLARAIDALVLMASGPTTDPHSSIQQLITAGIDLLALVLPALDRFTQSSWLLAGEWPQGLVEVMAQSLIYGIFIGAIGLFDFYRVND